VNESGGEGMRREGGQEVMGKERGRRGLEEEGEEDGRIGRWRVESGLRYGAAE